MDQREINKLTKKKSGLVIATIITINLKMDHMMIIILFLMTMIAHICFALIER